MKSEQDNFGAKIKERRAKKKLTRAELAKKIGVATSTVARWEASKQCPGGSNLLALCKILGARPKTILPTSGEAE